MCHLNKHSCMLCCPDMLTNSYLSLIQIGSWDIYQYKAVPHIYILTGKCKRPC